MPAPQNLGFEVVGARAGDAKGWTLNIVSSAREFGGFFAGQNLVFPSEAFAGTTWTPFNITPQDGQLASWDGALIGSALVESTDGGPVYHNLAQIVGATVSTSYVFEIEAKAGGQNFVFLASSNGLRAAWFNLSTGLVGTVAGPITATMTALGGGWYRCRIVDTITADGFQIGIDASDGGGNYTGTGQTAVYITRARVLTSAALALGVQYIATTETPVDLYLPFEAFENLWTNDGYLEAFTAAATSAGVYDTAPPYVKEPVEDFEEGWDANETYAVDILAISQIGLYDAGAHGYDGFTGWLSTSYVNAFIGPPTDQVLGLYDAGTHGYDAFLAGSWFAGSYLSAFVGPGFDLSQGVYSGTWANDTAETFERLLVPLSFLAAAINTTTDQITITAHGLSADEPVLVTTSDTLPAPLAATTTYYVGYIDPNTIKLKVAPGGAFVDFTTQGAGTHTIDGAPLSFWTYPPITSW